MSKHTTDQPMRYGYVMDAQNPDRAAASTASTRVVRCPKHSETLYTESQGCPECKREQQAAEAEKPVD